MTLVTVKAETNQLQTNCKSETISLPIAAWHVVLSSKYCTYSQAKEGRQLGLKKLLKPQICTI